MKKNNYRQSAYSPHRYEKGQSLIILALTFVAMLAFIGLVIDVGSLYVTYTQLKRAVDAAAVAAANNIKYPQASYTERKAKITESARELLILHNVTNVSSLKVYVCTDSDLPPDFEKLCPDTSAGEMPRKLAWVEATQESPVYFLRLFGVESIPFTTSAVGEAATVDLVLVFDTSESMASDIDLSDDGYATPGYAGNANNFDPSSCNANYDCYPMRQAKDAAAGLVGNLFDGYDQVAIVTYNYDAEVVVPLTSDLLSVSKEIDSKDAYDGSKDKVQVHDDASSKRTAWYSKPDPLSVVHSINPIFPDDRDGDGMDADPNLLCTDELTIYSDPPNQPGHDMWDDDTFEPCDDDDKLDTFDWDDDGQWGDDTYTEADINIDSANHYYEGTSLLSTCIGCGLRVAADQLKEGGRQASLWVILFLTDGIPNLSDTHSTYSEIPESFIYGFCGGGADLANNFWSTLCIDWDTSIRYCIDTDENECPPGTTHTTTSKPYSVDDYARDMADYAGLLVSDNEDEPLGEDIIIYSIALGTSGGAPLLRYIANIGEDGSRANDSCAGLEGTPNANCGNYYYAPKGAYLDQIFESIAGRIFTKISR